ncbi:MAG: hypothetical protein J6K61_05750 [Clostridia bacterium]|nr:hypothetical protein [Clostridia bacterium]
MLTTYTVTFAGHRDIDQYKKVAEKLYEVVSDFIRTKEFVEFYVGDNGDFDRLAASVIRRAKKCAG